MKTKNIFLAVFMFCFFSSAHAQIFEHRNKKEHAARPQVHINVKKQYDKNGNIIRYDSTYEWTYSNEGATSNINIDSLMQHFIPYFKKNIPDTLSSVFRHPKFDLNNPDMMLDFFNNEHFFDEWQHELFDMEHEMRTMDSLRMEFLKRYQQQHKKGKIKNPLKGDIY